MYSFFMKDMSLPVAPAKLQLKVKNKNKTIELINLGEVNMLKAPGLTDISLDMLIPGTNLPFAHYPDGFKEQSYYLGLLEQMKVGKEPFQFIVSRFSPGGRFLYDTNIKVSLEDYTIKESASEGMDLIVSVKLKQYKDYGTKKITVDAQAQTAQVETPRPAPEPARTYTVKSGDTLWGICKKMLGDGSMYPEVAELNDIANPNLIYPGQVIRFA